MSLKQSVCVVVILFSLTGCQPGGVSEPMRLVAKERSYVSDVPIPIGFTLDDAVSEDRMNRERRLYIRHVYQGNADIYSVRNFYIEYMPRYRWQMVHAGNVEGIHTIRFEKQDESCTITLSQSRGKVRAQVQLLYEGQSSNIGNQPS